MRFKFLLLLLLLALAIDVNAQKLVSKQLLDGKVTMMVPKDFVLMDDSVMKIKYPHERRPKVVYTDARGTVNVALNHTENKASQSEIENLLRATKQMFTNAQCASDWLNYGVKTINGRTFGYLEMITPAIDTRIYNLMFFTDIDNRAAIFSFNCTENYMEEWKDDAHAIMQSVVVK
jgi:hypothetical protein